VTAPENFVSRWARLKRNSDAGLDADSTGKASRPESHVGAKATAPHHQDDGADEPFDSASLPPVDTITFDTDIRGFLQSRVPAALTRAALRQAWASDPAIRDFIGIAENQWDFNDPTAMPGFGPMQETDNMPTLLARALGDRHGFADIAPEIPPPVENAPPAVADRASSPPDPSSQPGSEKLSSADEISDSPADSNEGTTTRNDGITREGGSSQGSRSHGGALPR
jgi:hypothetical protein